MCYLDGVIHTTSHKREGASILKGILWNGLRQHSLVEKIRHYPDGTVMQVLYLDFIDFREQSTTLGQSKAIQVLRNVYDHLLQITEWIPLSIVESLWDDAFIIIAPAASDPLVWVNAFEQATVDINGELRYTPTFHVGVSFFRHSIQHAHQLPEIIYRSLTHAAFVGKTSDEGIDSQMAKELYRILDKGLITPFYQPIYQLDVNSVLGYEALSRGPEQSPLRMPDVLFQASRRYGRLFELEHLCRKVAISDAPITNQQQLFVNMNPQTLNDPVYVKGRTKAWAKTKGIQPTQIVFEITENEAIFDYGTFRKTIDNYREQGYLIAIDDTGSGYSGLLTLVELSPDFIKLDRGLISQIDHSAIKQTMVEAMVMVAKKIGATTIAEGIETPSELAAVKQLGVDCGQGFLLGHPLPAIQYQQTMPELT